MTKLALLLAFATTAFANEGGPVNCYLLTVNSNKERR